MLCLRIEISGAHGLIEDLIGGREAGGAAGRDAGGAAGRQAVRKQFAGAAGTIRLSVGVWHHRRQRTEAAMGGTTGWVMVGLELTVVAIIAIALWLALRK